MLGKIGALVAISIFLLIQTPVYALQIQINNSAPIRALMTVQNSSGVFFKNLTAAKYYLLHKDIQQQQQFINNGSDPNFYCKWHNVTHYGVYCPSLHSVPFSSNKTGLQTTKGGEIY
jgi:hypothetical protein